MGGRPNQARDPNGRYADEGRSTRLHAMTGSPPAHDQPIGSELIDDAYDIADNLADHAQDWADLPVGGCYRINDFGDYVTEDDWDEVWDGHPLEEKAWMLADNGRYTSDDVARMTPAEIEAAYDEGAIYTDTYDQHPAYAYYTEKYEEDDYDLDEPIGATTADAIRQTGEQLAGQSRESMDFEPDEHVHATPDGFVSEAEWEQAWGDRPAYMQAAYELSCRHPGVNISGLTPIQIGAMNFNEDLYEKYIYEDGGTHHLRESDTMLSKQDRLSADMYRQNERNARYAGRDLNAVITMREAEYEGNDGTLTANVRDASHRVLDAPDPTGDMDSLSTIALGLNHDPDETVDVLTAMTATRSGDDPGLEQRLRHRLTSEPDAWSHADAGTMATLMSCITNNTDDKHGAAWLSASLEAFCDYRQGNKDQARRTAETVRRALKTWPDDSPVGAHVRQTADTVASVILEH